MKMKTYEFLHQTKQTKRSDFIFVFLCCSIYGFSQTDIDYLWVHITILDAYDENASLKCSALYFFVRFLNIIMYPIFLTCDKLFLVLLVSNRESIQHRNND